MQTLCLKTPPSNRHPLARGPVWRWLIGVLMSVHTLSVIAQNAVTTPLQSLEFQARQWAAQHPSFKGREVSVAPLDPRISVAPCQQMLQFEQPFPGQPSVRVRCMVPSWQLFITLVDGSGNASTARPGATY